MTAARAKRVVDSEGREYGWRIECPACRADTGNGAHILTTGEHLPTRWGFNGDPERPTFTPSLLCRYDCGEARTPVVCHSFIRDGRIEYLSDSTHPLAGQTFDLPEIEDAR
jgi:hypothetical protein